MSKYYEVLSGRRRKGNLTARCSRNVFASAICLLQLMGCM